MAVDFHHIPLGIAGSLTATVSPIKPDSSLTNHLIRPDIIDPSVKRPLDLLLSGHVRFPSSP